MPRKRLTAAQRRKRFIHREPNDMHTLESFCLANGISLATYYVLRAKGEGPRETRIGRRVLISPEAELAWRRQHEERSTKK